MPSTPRLRSLIGYMISRLVDVEASFGKTKLVKLLYLADVEYYRLYSRKLTGLDWVFYHYGPYASAIDDTLKELELDVPSEDTKTAAGHRAVVFKPSRDFAQFVEQPPTSEKGTIDRIVNKWGMEELNPLLSYVYFHTEPMRHAHRGEILDFSGIGGQVSSGAASLPKKPPVVDLRGLREQFCKMMAEHSAQSSRSLDPNPRLDNVFWNAVERLNSEEEYSVPAGSIEVTEEVKDFLVKEAGLDGSV